jgi:N-carbamoylputrescine amidase
MALQGADILLYPTVIGTEPQVRTIDSTDHWQRTMQSHAAAANVSIMRGNGKNNGRRPELDILLIELSLSLSY